LAILYDACPYIDDIKTRVSVIRGWAGQSEMDYLRLLVNMYTVAHQVQLTFFFNVIDRHLRLGSWNHILSGDFNSLQGSV
jgi:hypothetical protein